MTLIYQAVHPHGDSEVIEVIKEIAKVEKFRERDSLLFNVTLNESVKEFVVPVAQMIADVCNETEPRHDVIVQTKELTRQHQVEYNEAGSWQSQFP